MDRLLQAGDVFILEKGMTVYYQDMETTIGLKQKYATFIKQTVEVDGELYNKNKEITLEIPTPPEGEYIVLSTKLTGGGHGHGVHDYLPGGYQVTAKNVNSNEEVSFYQTIGFTARIMPDEITFVRKVIEGILEHKDDYSDSEYPYSFFINKENISDLLSDIEGKKVRITIEEIE